MAESQIGREINLTCSTLISELQVTSHFIHSRCICA